MGIRLEVAIVVGLILLNGFFALAEMAIVASRRVRLQQLAEAGSTGAARALALSEDPGRFLSSVQVGITLIGVLSGAFGGSTLGARLGSVLIELGWFGTYGDDLAFFTVVLVITALSVVIGELVPKRFALANPERLAVRVARPLDIFSHVFRPFVWVLGRSSDALLALFGLKQEASQGMTEEEIRFAIAEGTHSGVIDDVEEEMIHGVLELADRPVQAIMTPRPDIYWIDLDDPADEIARDVAECPYSRLVVARDGDMSHPMGVVQKKDLVASLMDGTGLQIEEHLLEPLHVPEGSPAMHVLQNFRTRPLRVAFVFDEYGDFQGLVTLTDIMSAIAGQLPEEHRPTPQEIFQRDDGSWLVDGRASVTEVKEALDLTISTDGEFHTAAGLALDALERIPVEGDSFTIDGWRVEVIDMDGNRIDKLLFIPPSHAEFEESPAT